MIRPRQIIAGSINAPQAHKSNPYRSAPKARYVHVSLYGVCAQVVGVQSCLFFSVWIRSAKMNTAWAALL